MKIIFPFPSFLSFLSLSPISSLLYSFPSSSSFHPPFLSLYLHLASFFLFMIVICYFPVARLYMNNTGSQESKELKSFNCWEKIYTNSTPSEACHECLAGFLKYISFHGKLCLFLLLCNFLSPVNIT